VAISINPLTYVIYVPKADMTLTQSSPETRELNVNAFRLELKSLEDDPDYGVFLYKTHSHNTEVALAGLTYARTVEVLAPYTVEFEDGQYTVNCVGANHNLSDRKVANQVSLIVNNAAGLISNAQIEYSSFNGGVTVDVDNLSGKATSGTVFPIGTPQQPVNNMADAILIAAVRGITQFFVVGDLTLTTGDNVADKVFIGESAGKSTITVETGADVLDCEFYECTLTGVLDGNAHVKNCAIGDLTYISGYVELCILNGVITLGGGAAAYFLDCWAGSLLGSPPKIDLGGSGQTLVMQNFNGYIQWENKSGSDQANASLNAGWILLASSITAGSINIIGTGIVEDYTTGTASVNTVYLTNPVSIKDTLMGEALETGITVRQALQSVLAAAVGKAAGGGTSTITFRNTADDTNRVVMTVDDNGNRTSVVLNA
jgi:hypothetical protein